MEKFKHLAENTFQQNSPWVIPPELWDALTEGVLCLKRGYLRHHANSFAKLSFHWHFAGSYGIRILVEFLLLFENSDVFIEATSSLKWVIWKCQTTFPFFQRPVTDDLCFGVSKAVFFFCPDHVFQPSTNCVYRLTDAEVYTNFEVSRTPGSTGGPGMSTVSCLMEVSDAVSNRCWGEGPMLWNRPSRHASLIRLKSSC